MEPKAIAIIGVAAIGAYFIMKSDDTPVITSITTRAQEQSTYITVKGTHFGPPSQAHPGAILTSGPGLTDAAFVPVAVGTDTQLGDLVTGFILLPGLYSAQYVAPNGKTSNLFHFNLT